MSEGVVAIVGIDVKSRFNARALEAAGVTVWRL